MQRVAEDERLFGSEEEVGAVVGVLAALADEGGGTADGIGHTGHDFGTGCRGGGLCRQ